MNTYPVGSAVRVTAAYSAAGTATDPTVVTCQIKDPTGTITAYTYGGSGGPVRDSTGNYHYDVDTPLAGVYAYRWEGTGTVIAAQEGVFYSGPSQFV